MGKRDQSSTQTLGNGNTEKCARVWRRRKEGARVCDEMFAREKGGSGEKVVGEGQTQKLLFTAVCIKSGNKFWSTSFPPPPLLWKAKPWTANPQFTSQL